MLSTRLSFESLESREMLSGNVHVFWTQDGWRGEGDSANNSLLLAPAPGGKVRITGLEGTKVNGKASDDFDASKPLTINLYGGDDKVDLKGTSAKQPLVFGSYIRIQGSEGADTITATDVTTKGQAKFDMGGGSTYLNDSVRLTRLNAYRIEITSQRPRGLSEAQLTNCTTTADLSINLPTSGGNTIASVVGGKFGSMHIETGYQSATNGQSDSVNVTGGVKVDGKLEIDTYSGPGNVNLDGVSADYVDVDNGNGRNIVTVKNTIARLATFDDDGGASDQITGYNNTFKTKPTIKNYETNKLTYKIG